MKIKHLKIKTTITISTLFTLSIINSCGTSNEPVIKNDPVIKGATIATKRVLSSSDNRVKVFMLEVDDNRPIKVRVEYANLSNVQEVLVLDPENDPHFGDGYYKTIRAQISQHSVQEKTFITDHDHPVVCAYYLDSGGNKILIEPSQEPIVVGQKVTLRFNFYNKEEADRLEKKGYLTCIIEPG